MFKGFGDLANLMKNAREIQEKIESLKESLVRVEVEGLSGGGLVRIRGRGDGTVVSVDLDEELVRGGDREMMEDLLVAAMNNLQEKLNEVRKEKISELTGGLNLPPGVDLGL